MADLKLKGGADLQRYLEQLPAKIEQNIMRSAMRAGAKVLLEEAQRQVPVNKGPLRDSLKISTSSKNGTVRARVRTKLFYARFIEFGAAAHDIKPKDAKSLFWAGIMREIVKHPGLVPKPFLRPSMDAAAAAAIVAVGEQVQRRLTKQGIDTPDSGLEVEE